VVSKAQIAFESKAQADAKAQHTFKYVSILIRLRRSNAAIPPEADSMGF